jgi:hypothetical protein
MTRWDEQRVTGLAPDAASLAAARKLALPGPWSDTGSNDVLVWGKCQGSGKTPYQTSVDLTGPAFRCTCPSRKFPCKHALALLLLWSRGAIGEGAADGDAPDAGAAEWARSRAERAARAAAKAAGDPVEGDAAPDPAAQAKRLADRIALMSGGVDDLALWLADLVRSGAGEARSRDYAYWEAAARRLVDAQLPGLAARVRETPGVLATGGVPGLLAELGIWWSLLCAWRRRDDLDPDDAAALRAALGWAVPTAEVRAADAVTGVWTVLGARREDRGRLAEQRTWLRSAEGETVLVLDFAGGGQPLPVPRLTGAVLRGTVSRYPGPGPRRALLHDDVADVPDAAPAAPLDRPAGVVAALDAAAGHLARDPWAARTPVAITAALVASAGSAALVDADGAAIGLTPDSSPWPLAALTGGHPVAVFGELEAGALRPLSAVVDGELVAL